MGCTSSTPNMTPSKTDSENNLKRSEDELNKNIIKRPEIGISEIEQRKLNDTHENEDTIEEMALPTCDTVKITVNEPLARNNTWITDAPSLNVPAAAENNEIKHIESEISNSPAVIDLGEPPEILPPPESADMLETDEKLSTLEEVVEKVVEYHDTAKIDTLDYAHDANNEENNSKSHNSETNSYTEEVQRAPSPNQSDSSRATRWEALADAAAELPPSCTVDPITGQIYSYYK